MSIWQPESAFRVLEGHCGHAGGGCSAEPDHAVSSDVECDRTKAGCRINAM